MMFTQNRGRRLSDGGEGRPFRWKLLGTSLYNYFMRVSLLCDSAQCRSVTVTVWLGNECAGMSFYFIVCHVSRDEWMIRGLLLYVANIMINNGLCQVSRRYFNLFNY